MRPPSPIPLPVVDDAGIAWYVIDERHEPLAAAPPPRATPGTDPRARGRRFARRSPLDGGWDVYGIALLRDDDPTDLSRGTLLRQLAAATGPAMRPGERLTACLARLRALHPTSFLPPAWPHPLPPIARRDWSILLASPGGPPARRRGARRG